MERTSAARHRPNATARFSALANASPAVGGLQGVQLGDLGGQPVDPAAAAPVINASPRRAARNEAVPDRSTGRGAGLGVVSFLVSFTSVHRGASETAKGH